MLHVSDFGYISIPLVLSISTSLHITTIMLYNKNQPGLSGMQTQPLSFVHEFSGHLGSPSGGGSWYHGPRYPSCGLVLQ